MSEPPQAVRSLARRDLSSYHRTRDCGDRYPTPMYAKLRILPRPWAWRGTIRLGENIAPGFGGVFFMDLATLIFWIVAIVLVGSALIVVLQRNIVHSALALILVFAMALCTMLRCSTTM